jgi:hypothetical protein
LEEKRWYTKLVKMNLLKNIFSVENSCAKGEV